MKHHKTKSPNLNVRPRATKIMTVTAAAMIFATAGFTCIETRIVAPVWDGVLSFLKTLSVARCEPR